MAHLVCGRFGFNAKSRTLRPLALNLSKVNYSSLNYNGKPNRQGYRRLLQQQPPFNGAPYINAYRAYGMLVARVLRGALKLRYLVLGGTLGGGAALSNKYEQWKEGLPDMKWLDEVLPDSEQWGKFSKGLLAMSAQMKDSIQVDPRLKQLTEERMAAWRNWFDSRLDNAIKAAETSDNPELDSSFQRLSELVSDIYGVTKEELKLRPVNAKSADEAAASSAAAASAKKHRSMQQQIEQLQSEMMSVQLKYQRELEKLDKENKALRQQFLLMKTNRKTAAKKIKKSLIDMYSEVLDELSGYDTSYQTADHLPRVVVVGDQSSGKTSVLEAIAQARIFPRGSGEMMTRAPVKVTLAEGPYHVASFRGSDREFDLTKESELADLRREVELRMRNSVRGGKTVSTDVISMTVKGPGLQRMVLVDLPGIISTVTVDMAHDTKDSIQQMTKHYMSNPNAIILCIQDGSVDAERSNVTDFVSQCDPLGKRTIFVLTKVDLAEELADPERIRRILAGKLFPMRALGYYAVVTGRGRTNETIESIRDYEENFFKTSKLFQKSGAVMPHQVTTRNLSLAVADRFWKMVSESIEQQADAFKATRFNLETEWKNQFPRQRITSRDENYEKAKGEILDQIITLSQISPKQWDETFEKHLWDKISSYVFENIYLPAAQSQKYSFNTLVDIKLREWAEQSLPAKSVECGWDGLQQVLLDLIERSKSAPENDDTFDNVKQAVVDETIRRHKWEDKAVDMLRVIQLNVLEDSAVHSKAEWDQAVACFESFVRERLQQNERTIEEMFGPGTWESWMRWRSATEEQHKRRQVKTELDKVLQSDKKHAPSLSYDELTTIRKNVQRNNGLDVEPEFIREVWYPIYRKHFLQQALSRANNGKKAYYLYTTQGSDCPVDCSDIILFWRIQQMVKVTATALRQQVINREAKRLDKEIKEVLDEFGDDEDKKAMLLASKRVALAEEIIRVRQIQEKLEEFINNLNKEK